MTWFPRSIFGLIGFIVLLAALPALVAGVLSAIPMWVWTVACVTLVAFVVIKFLGRGKKHDGGTTHYHHHYW